MTKHHAEDYQEQTREFRRPSNGKKALVAGLSAIAGIVIAVPIVFGWVGTAVELSKMPEKVKAMEARQDNLERSQAEIKESLARIEGALHIAKSPKQKDEQP
jgi:hypothetical protein